MELWYNDKLLQKTHHRRSKNQFFLLDHSYNDYMPCVFSVEVLAEDVVVVAAAAVDEEAVVVVVEEEVWVVAVEASGKTHNQTTIPTLTRKTFANYSWEASPLKQQKIQSENILDHMEKLLTV